MKINKLYLNTGLIVLGLSLVYFMAVVVVPNMLVTLTKAAPASTVSIADSYFLGGKILAKPTVNDFCVVNVFAMDSAGKGVKGKEITVMGMGDNILSGVTDIDGKATFQVKSTTEGQFKLEATIDGISIGKTVTLTFRN